MTSTNPAAEGGATQASARPEATTGIVLEEIVGRRESRRERRLRRRAERRARMARARSAWVVTSVDAGLPGQVQDRLPGWAATGRGRVLLAEAAVVALLVWALVFVVVAGR